MKHTSLFSAVAIAAAMGTQALATVTTNDVGSANFNSLTTGLVYSTQALSNEDGTWSVQSEDQSEIIAAPLSSADAVEGYTANKHLKLNTEGQELVWTPGTVSEPKSIIEMKVRLVASDTAPVINTNDVHAAVYLQVSETPNASVDGLYALTGSYNSDPAQNTLEWVRIGDSDFNAQLATGSMVALRVLMDYDSKKATYEGCILADAENAVLAYDTLGQTNMANPNESVTTLTSVAFKGTGGVDDLFVGQIHETPSKAGIRFEFWDAQAVIAEPQNQDTANITNELDTVEQNASVGTAFEYDPEDEGLVILSVELIEDGTNLTWKANATPTVDALGNIDVSMANYDFVPEHTYLVKVTYGLPAPTTYQVTFVSEGSEFFSTNVVAGDPIVAPDPAPTKAADAEYTYEFEGWYTDAQFSTKYTFGNAVNSAFSLYANFTSNAIPAVTGVEFGTFAIVDGTAQFTAFSVSGTTATATLSANIESTGTQTQKTLYAKYETALGSGSYGYAAATVTGEPTAGTPGSVTFTFTVPSGNALFLRGLSNENGSN